MLEVAVACRLSNQAARARLSVVSKTRTKAIIVKMMVLVLGRFVEGFGPGNGSRSMSSFAAF